MAQVTVKINGYSYTVVCEDGQEPHLLAMAREVDTRIDGIRLQGGSSGESRLLMLASLLMADGIHDLQAELKEARAATGHASDSEAARKLNGLAMRAEQIASSLDRT
jgi:cell division protein ZapA